MSIYTPIQITEKIEFHFKPTRLAIKELNGLKYFCKTVGKNIEKYPGSGVRWTHHVNKYGKEHIKTLWVSDWFHCPHHLQDFALMFSEYNNIVESEDWANLIPENGLTGNTGSKKGHMSGVPKPKSDAHRKSISDTLSGVTLEERHGKEKADEIKSKMSTKRIGRKNSKEANEKTAAWHRGKKRSIETKERMRESRKQYEKHTCVHCMGTFNPGNFNRWHGEYCLKNPNATPRKITNRPKTRVTKSSISVEVNGITYRTIAAAVSDLNLPANLIRKMLNKGLSSYAEYNIFSLKQTSRGDVSVESSPSD
jgi:hypothetical protein